MDAQLEDPYPVYVRGKKGQNLRQRNHVVKVDIEKGVLGVFEACCDERGIWSPSSDSDL